MSVVITPEIKDQIKNRTSLVELVRAVTPDLKKKGKFWWACCPFHTEKTPSFHVREAEGNYYCFGCGASGDAITFIMETQGADFPTAVADLANRAGITLQYEERDPAEQKQREDGYAVLAEAAQFFTQNYANSASKIYIKEKRGLTEDTVKTFDLGHAQDDWRTLFHHLQQAGFSKEIIEKAGLVKVSDKGGEPYDTFRNRLIFPILDRKNRVVGFGGRRLSNDENAGPKYLNSPDTPFFNKGHMLYNLNYAQETMRKTNQALLVEGYMDVIALWQVGIHTAVAPLGTAVTEDQISLLWRTVPAPIICLDGDMAGKSAAERLAKRALPIMEPGKTLTFAFLPDGEDPDTFIQHQGREAFLKLVRASAPLETVLWAMLTKDNSDLTTADARAGVDAAISELMATITNPTVRTHMARVLKDKLWQASRTKSGSKKASHAIQPATAKKEWLPQVKSGADARQLLAFVCKYPPILEKYEENFFELSFENQEDKMLSELIARAITQEGLEPSALTPYLLEAPLADHVQHLIDRVPELTLEEANDAFVRLLATMGVQAIIKAKKKESLHQLKHNLTAESWEEMKQHKASRKERLAQDNFAQ